mgnify:CR=1 FL=1
MASIIAAGLGEALGDRLGEAKLGIAHGLKQQSLGDIYAIKDDRKRLQEFVKRVRSGQYQPTRVDSSGKLIE